MKIPSIPQVYRHVNRWREIVSVLSKYGLAGWISRFDLDFAKGILKTRDGAALARTSRERRIRLALEELGPAFIKLGQIFSTRPDLIGNDLADELKQLQCNVPSDPPERVREMLALELGCPVEECFASFDDTPLASASIGQVHRARLHSGEDVVVKIQHYNIEKRLRVDLDMMVGLAQMAEFIPELAAQRPTTIVNEFRRVLRRELDFERELRNIQQFAHDFRRLKTVHIPKVYSQLSTTRVLTLEFLDGPKLCDSQELVQAGVDAATVAQHGAQLYLEMIFGQGFYHADPHPGNLILMRNNVIGLVDFGMVGRLDESLREEVEEMLMAIVDRDAYYLTSIIMRIGAAPPDLDEQALCVDVADFVDHYGSQPIDRFDLSGALREMLEIIRRYHIVLPAPLALLLKVLIMLEGTAQMLCPKFCLMEVMQPYRRRLLLRRMSPGRQIKKMRRLYHEAEQLVTILPRRIMDILEQVQSGKFDVHLDHRGLEPSVNRLVLGMLASALFLGSSIMLSRGVGPKLFDIPVLGACGCVLAVMLGIRLLRAISKSGHLDRRK